MDDRRRFRERNVPGARDEVEGSEGAKRGWRYRVVEQHLTVPNARERTADPGIAFKRSRSSAPICAALCDVAIPLSAMITAVKEPVLPIALSTRRDLIEALEAAHESAVEYWSDFETPEFFAPIGSHWSPSEHVRHLTRAMTPLLPALRMPRSALRLLFGAVATPSRSYDAIEAAYAQALAAGGTAGRYAPSPERSTPDSMRRDAIMDAHSETLRGMTQALERWTEAQIDAYRLPHPLLGKLTVREMMLFTLIHNQHHVQVAQRRWGEMHQQPAF